MSRSKALAPVAGAAAGALIGVLLTRKGLPLPHVELGRLYPAIALWFVFFLYWSVAARNAAPTRSSESSGSTLFHQLLLNAALLLLILPVPGFTGRVLPAGWLPVVLGAAIQAGFILLAVWARRHLGRNWSAEVRIAVDHQLVRTGPYRRLRHPIYTAMLGMFLATAVASGELHSMLALLLLAALYRRKTRLEEEVLVKTFGAEYHAYRRESWSLVPWLI